MKIIVVTNYLGSMVNFRGHLLQLFVKHGHEVMVCSPGGHDDVELQLSKIGVMHRRIAIDRTGFNPVNDFFTLISLVKLFKREKPDLLLNYTIKPVIYATIAGFFSNINRIYSVITGLGHIFTSNKLFIRIIRIFIIRLYRFALRHNTIVFFLNGDDIKYFRQLQLINHNAVQLNGEGVDTSLYKPVDCKGEQITFLLIARLIWEKGIKEFVQAAEILKKRHPNAIFQILGPLDSNPTAITQGQILAWQRSGVIEYLGETKDVQPFIANSSVYVLPSYREGLPRTVLEAMAMGRPIVTTDTPGCRETVTDGDNGFLVPVKDVAALAAAMEKFILQPELIKKMGKRSRKIVEEKYDVNKVNAHILYHMGLLNDTTL